MVLSEAQKRDAYREARQVLALADKWQELMPGERKPNFQRAAQEILKRALGHKTSRNEQPLKIHGGLMHEHEPREARLIERTLRAGVIHPDVLHSFQHDIVTVDPEPESVEYDIGEDPELPDIEVYSHDPSRTIDYPSHYEPATNRFHSSVVKPHPFAKELKSNIPAGSTMHSTYEVVH